ncbi:MAG: periplasmic divalent cation tolerance protein [Nitrospirae bacterium]|nr:MAG: periplasmic divalent cation tolerance protein [Nitrospirota bacterium]
MDYIVVFITAPNEEEAAKMARVLVEEKLAGCVNIVRSISSIYSWQGKTEDDSEALMICKTKKSLFDALKERVIQLHPYTVPEIVALPIIAGSEKYLDWLREVTQ